MRSRNSIQSIASGILAVIAMLVAGHPCSAQLVSVQCCSIEADFEGIINCLGGAGVLVRPPSCAPGATCVLGFGEDSKFMEGLCDVPQFIPEFSYGFCSSWSDETTPVVHRCVAIPSASVTMFEVFDDEGDGDLDFADMSMFKQVYDRVPKLDQSEAETVSVECCIHDALLPQVAECMSGPGVTTQPVDCSITPVCVTGFSAPLEYGDWLYRVCDDAPTPPGEFSSQCMGWQNSDKPVVFECQNIPTAAPSFFTLADTDTDADVDLRDFAVLQREIIEE